MAKTCKQDNCENPAFSKGYCQWHMPKKPLNAKKKPMQARSPLKKVSGKRARELAVYSALRKEHLEKNPNCVACGGKADQIHHRMQIRYGKFVNDVSQFLSMCGNCHTFTHNNVDFSIKEGYLASKEEKAKYLRDNL